MMFPSYHAFPKIFHLGDPIANHIFNGPVEITEKVDGSQFAFAKIDGELTCRSKRKFIIMDAPDKMFNAAINAIQGKGISDRHIYYGEYLQRPKHNVLAYNRVPKNNIAIFGIYDRVSGSWLGHDAMICLANFLEFDVVPMLYGGWVTNFDEFKHILDGESFLGGCKIEGMVIKNYTKKVLVGNQVLSPLCCKFVREDFKERANQVWKKEHTRKGKIETFLQGFQNEARWQKAVQHLREADELEGSPRDIGKLIKAIYADVFEEDEQYVKDSLFKMFKGDISRMAVRGFPEWYKEHLVKNVTE